MALKCSLSDDDHDLTISMGERFDYDAVEDLKEAYPADETGLNYIIDLSTTESMDLNALGMLLSIRKVLGGSNDISIVNCRPNIKRLLLMAKLDKKFNIE